MPRTRARAHTIPIPSASAHAAAAVAFGDGRLDAQIFMPSPVALAAEANFLNGLARAPSTAALTELLTYHILPGALASARRLPALGWSCVGASLLG